jgi:hypothetical protein
VGEDFFGGFAGDYFGEGVEAGALDVGDAAEFAEEFAGGGWADAGDFAEGGFGLALGAAEAVESDGEAVGFVADGLDEMEDGVVAVEFDRLVFLAVEVEDFFLFGDAGEGLVDDGEGFESFGGGVELADAAVDEDEAGESLIFFEDAFVAASDGFAHGGEVVILGVGGAGVDGDDAGERNRCGRFVAGDDGSSRGLGCVVCAVNRDYRRRVVCNWRFGDEDGVRLGCDGLRLVDDWLGDGAAGEIAADDEFAVVGFFHAAVFPDDHAGDGVAALNVGDVEAFDAARFF